MFSRYARKRLREFDQNPRKRLKSSEIEHEEEQLESEIKVGLELLISNQDQELEAKINTIDGLTSTTTEAIRLKYSFDCQVKREQKLRTNIVFATETQSAIHLYRKDQ